MNVTSRKPLTILTDTFVVIVANVFAVIAMTVFALATAMSVPGPTSGSKSMGPRVTGAQPFVQTIFVF